MHFRTERFHEVWDAALAVLTIPQSKTANPRGLNTTEVVGVTLRVDSLRQNILVNSGRDLNYRFMVAEFLWIALGRDDTRTISRYNREILRFSDDGETMYGSYGRRLQPQWDRIRDVLVKDHMTRQSVGVIFNADMKRETRDTPCTISLQWLLRSGRLNCIATMRSSDVWLGLPYDFYVFSQLTNCLAAQLGVDTGWLQMQLGSLHLYETNYEKAQEVQEEWKSYTIESPLAPGWPSDDMHAVLEQPFNADKLTLGGQDLVYAKVLKAPTKIRALGVLKEEYNAQTVGE